MAAKLWGVIFKMAVIVLFIVCLAVALFFANGYSYDFVGQEFRKTGGIDLKYNDQQATVFLDGKKLEGHLPFVASNILPGKYNLVVAREGFWNWQRQVEIKPDLIQKISDVVLFPMQADQFSNILAKFSSAASIKYLFRGSYLFAVNGTNLTYYKLTPDLTIDRSNSVKIPGELSDLEVWQTKGQMHFNNGDKYLIDLDSGKMQKNLLADNYLPTENKWIEWNGGNLAFFDQNLKKILWAGEFANQEINQIRYQNINQREFLKIRFSNDQDWTLFEFKNYELTRLQDRIVDGPWAMNNGTFLVLTRGNELWQIPDNNLSQDKPVLWQRFSRPVQILAYLPKTNSLALIMDGQLGLADLNFYNFIVLFPEKKISGQSIDPEGNIYYLENTDTADNETALHYLDWQF